MWYLIFRPIQNKHFIGFSLNICLWLMLTNLLCDQNGGILVNNIYAVFIDVKKLWMIERSGDP